MSDADRSPGRVRAELVVRGRVQGVFYRASARAEALRLGLTGEVRNLPGGEVQAVAEGERSSVEAFIAWCRRGPPGARVDDVQVSFRAPQGMSGSFRVAH